jgi:hypothetical protein
MMNAKENIEAALSRSVCGGWDRDFLESILEQTTKGRALTLKQNQTLGNVLARNTPEAQTEHEGWSTSYESDFKDNALILAKYHLRQPYYKPMATDIIEGKVPERRKFLRMYENKYSKKVLAQSKSAPKYSVGDYINTRAAFDSYKNVEFEGQMAWTEQNKIVSNFKGRGGFILEIDRNIYSPAKGAKRYKILPIGCTTPLIVEERYIKLNKKRR